MGFKKINTNVELLWNNCLVLYLYYVLIKLKKNICKIDPSDYNAFKLYEDLIEEYNNDIDNSTVIDTITNWYYNNKETCREFELNFGNTYKSKVVIWNDRNKTDYFEEKLQAGHEYEEYIKELFLKKGVSINLYQTKEGQYNQGESEVGIEIKYDMLWKSTNNLYIEYQERSREGLPWTNSGILKDDNSRYYLIGDYDRFWIFRKERLLEIYKNGLNKDEICKGFRFTGNPTSKGFIFPISYVETIEISLEEVVKEIKSL